MNASTISSINNLPLSEKRAIFASLIPPELLARLQIPNTLIHSQGDDLLILDCPAGNNSVEMKLYHHVVRDEAVREEAIAGVVAAVRDLGLKPAGRLRSPLPGPAGNVEELVWFRRGG